MLSEDVVHWMKLSTGSYSTLGNCGHRAPHGSFMSCAIFFGQSA